MARSSEEVQNRVGEEQGDQEEKMEDEGKVTRTLVENPEAMDSYFSSGVDHMQLSQVCTGVFSFYAGGIEPKHCPHNNYISYHNLSQLSWVGGKKRETFCR